MQSYYNTKVIHLSKASHVYTALRKQHLVFNASAQTSPDQFACLRDSDRICILRSGRRLTGSLPSEQHRDLLSQPLDITDLCSLSKAKQTTWSVPIVCTRSFSSVYRCIRLHASWHVDTLSAYAALSARRKRAITCCRSDV